MQLRKCEIMQYVEYLTVDIQRVIKEHTMIKQWAYILHDKDDTGPHYHIFLDFGKSPYEVEDIAKWFEIKPQYVNKVKGKKADMLLYLIHGNDTQQYKYQYDPKEVISNFDYEAEIKTSQIIGDFEHYSYAQMLTYVNSLPVGEKSKTFTLLEKLWKIHCQAMTLNPDRKLEVVFICGGAGTGKTTYARKMLKEMGFDFCVSSSSNDPFQDYLGQKAIILDDLRDKAFEFEDLLKILDNNTASSVRSRFANKVFNGEMIVITSSIPLCRWYDESDKKISIDSLEQLYRRFSYYIVMDENEIRIYSELDGYGKPTGFYNSFVNDIPRLKAMPKERVDLAQVFGKFCSPTMPEKW